MIVTFSKFGANKLVNELYSNVIYIHATYIIYAYKFILIICLFVKLKNRSSRENEYEILQLKQKGVRGYDFDWFGEYFFLTFAIRAPTDILKKMRFLRWWVE